MTVKTEIVTVGRSEAHNANRVGLSFHCPDGTTWAGSYATAVTAVLADLLAEGPLPVRLYVPDGESRCSCWTGMLTEVVAGVVLAFADGLQVRIDDTASIFLL